MIQNTHQLYEQAMRTGRYRYIQVVPVYEGEVLIADRISGFHHIERDPEKSLNKEKVLGYMGQFEMYPDFKSPIYYKSFYMTIEQIQEHAKEHSLNYDDPQGLWKKHPEKMAKNLVMRLFLTKEAVINAEEQIIEEIKEEPKPKNDLKLVSKDELMKRLGF